MMNLWIVSMALFLAALPASNNYELGSYGFGTGGTSDSSSSNYRINGAAGEVAGQGNSTNYQVGAGVNYEQQANVPLVTITNDDNWYNKLKIVIDPQNNPTDALFAVAISTDGFVTTQYVKSDLTISSSLSLTDYQTYTSWGGAMGVLIRGLSRSTVYSVKAKAMRGKFTESGYGPTSSASTVDPTLVFDIDVAPTDTSTSPPYVVDFGSIPVSTVSQPADQIWVSLSTNGESGGKVYLSGQNAGLRSSLAGYTISSATGDLSSLAEGFGAQGVSVAQTSGGPLSLVAPYNLSGAQVGVADTVIRELFTAPAPITSGRGAFTLLAKTQPLTPSGGDYAELLRAIASASF
jgi:hypothetical protein